MHRFKPVGVDFFQFVENHFSHDISLLTFDSAAGHALHEVALSQKKTMMDGRMEMLAIARISFHGAPSVTSIDIFSASAMGYLSTL